MKIPINLVFEDELSEFVLTKLLDGFGNKFCVGVSYNGRGFGYIKSKINGFNQACVATPFLILTDLDNRECPIELINDWFNNVIHENMIFRIAVREVESWLLADIEGLSKFLRVSSANFPREPELEPDPKRTLINLARRSNIRSIREDIIPINDNAKIGPNYNGKLSEFVFGFWDLSRAMDRSQSLARTYQRLQDFKYTAPEN